MYSSGQFARIFRVSKKLIRHYHEIGLLIPSDIDPLNGYQYYNQDALERMEKIIYLRSLRIPLSDIKYLLDNPEANWLDKIHQNLILIRKELGVIERVEKEFEMLKQKLLTGRDVFEIMKKETGFEFKVFYLDTPIYIVGCSTGSVEYGSRMPKIEGLITDYFGNDIPSTINHRIIPTMRFGIVEETGSNPHEIQYIMGDQVQQMEDIENLPGSLINHIIPAGNYACVTFSGPNNKSVTGAILEEAYGKMFGWVGDSEEWAFGKHVSYEIYDDQRFDVPSWPEMDLWVPVNKK